ncbi:MAG: acyl-CoA dehydrogenase family protein [Acidimicrobiales bacterium]|nr:acyl-CoA dehydrogenase family protein [Acidimicrobiales bacterium]MCB9393143.1 acyl-CoA dehydrogenase family protein [Acidimicrobiaceae bacterium]
MTDVQSITLTDEQREFRAVLRQFVADKIAPLAGEIDRSGEYSWTTFEALQAMELTALSYPAEYGGSGASLVDQAIAAEELARGCTATSLQLLISKLGMLPVINFGSEFLKSTYLPRICSGASQCSYGLSEPDAGSDVASMSTKAVRDGDGWVIDGTKCWITNAGISDLYTIFARTSNDRHTGITAFLVEAAWGVQVDKLEHKLGIKGSPTGVIRLDAVRVPDTHRIGEVGQGFAIAMHTLDRSRPTIGAQAVGIAQGALDASIAYMKERTTFGRPIGSNQGLQWMAADAAMRVEAARQLVYRACAIADQGDPHGELSMAGAMAKCFASDVAMQVTTDAVQFLGGYGYTTDFPVERMMRDAKITQIYEGTNQIQRMVISKKLGL